MRKKMDDVEGLLVTVILILLFAIFGLSVGLVRSCDPIMDRDTLRDVYPECAVQEYDTTVVTTDTEIIEYRYFKDGWVETRREPREQPTSQTQPE